MKGSHIATALTGQAGNEYLHEPFHKYEYSH
jgi:hypothetical protein